jgi:hypothetical protein
MFPNLSHKSIKLRFKAEEKKDSDRVSRALRNRLKAPDEVRQRMLEGVGGKRIIEDGVLINAYLGLCKVALGWCKFRG